MRHDWIIDVLSDLRSYALKNGLPELAAEVEACLRVARTEIAAPGHDPGEPEGGAGGGMPPGGRPH